MLCTSVTLLSVLIFSSCLCSTVANVKDPYASWKDDQIADLELEEIRTFPKKIIYFTGFFNINLEEYEKVKGGSLETGSCSSQSPEYTRTFLSVYETEMLYAYNFLREMLGQELAKSMREVI